jgi:choline dehydrogenase-like flavoprotein
MKLDTQKRFISRLLLLGTLINMSTPVLIEAKKRGDGSRHHAEVVGEFDIVIVGLGTSGSVLAAELSADPSLSICVLEAGADDTRVEPELPLKDNVRYPFLTKENNFWPDYERKGIFTWGDLVTQGFHQFAWAPQERDTADSRSVYYARCSAFGGSTCHAQVCLRGDTTDYNKWVALGLTEWNVEAMRAAYRKNENRSQTNILGSRYFSETLNKGVAGNFNPENYNDSGPVPIVLLSAPSLYKGGDDIGFTDPLTKALIEVGDNLPGGFNTENGGILRDGDSLEYESKPVVIATPITDLDQLGTKFKQFNNYNDDGAAYPPGTAFGLSGLVSDFQRVTAANAIIYPIEHRPNLTIKSKVLATKITFDKCNKANGVEFLEGYNILSCGRNPNTQLAGFGGTPQDAQANAIQAKNAGFKKVIARKEVIVCGGVFNSPHLLMLSGVGPKEKLQELGIQVISDLPGVGKNLQDHAEVDHYWLYDDIFINPFDATFGFLGWWVGVPTVRLKSDPKRVDYDYHAHVATGFNFCLDGGGIVNWTDGRLDIRKVGPPSYVHNRLNNELILDFVTDFRTTGWALLEHQKNSFSRGFVELVSADPTVAPKIVMNHLKEQADIDSYVSAFQNGLWPLIEGLRNKDYTLAVDFENNPYFPSTVSQGSGSLFGAWLWPQESMFLDTTLLKPSPLFSTGGSTAVVVTQENHGLGAAGTNTHVRLENVEPFNGIDFKDLNQLQYVTVIDADNYSFEVSKPAASTSAGGGALVTAKTFNRENYIAFITKYCWGHHASGTCKMGVASDPMAVVDQHCRVYGTKGLRVVDCSIAPIVQSANTQAAAYAYGNRAAELIIKDLNKAKKGKNKS